MCPQTIYSKLDKLEARKTFRKLGTCSRTFFHILNREFGHPKEIEERAADPLAGGIMRKGYQCGMLWGSSLAVGAEAYRRCDNLDQAIGVAILATQRVMASFAANEHTINCKDITHCDFNSNWSFAKYILTGRFLYCFKMAEKWAPKAILSAMDGFLNAKHDLPYHNINCASEVAKRMGASDEELVMVSGFAGGMGLSGSACGALSAAIWINTLDWCREVAEKSPHNNPYAIKTIEAFREVMDDKILCHEITSQHFQTLEEHSQYLKNGGCEKLINVLALTKNQEIWDW